MRRSFGVPIFVALSVAGVLLFGNAGPVRAKSGCSNASLRGSYGIQATGSAASGPFAGPIAFVGVLMFDGSGGLAGNLTLRLNTATGPTTQDKVPYAGTYTVNADCTVEDIWINQLNGGFNTHESVLVDHGKELLILVTTAGAPPIVSGVGRKLFADESER